MQVVVYVTGCGLLPTTLVEVIHLTETGVGTVVRAKYVVYGL